MHPDGPDDTVGLQVMSLVPPGRLAENTENYETNYTSKIESFAVSSVQNRELMKVIILLETFIQYVGLS